MDVGATAQQEPVHRRERSVALVGRRSRVDADRVCAVPLDRGDVQVVATGGEVRAVAQVGETERHDDPRPGLRLRLITHDVPLRPDPWSASRCDAMMTRACDRCLPAVSGDDNVAGRSISSSSTLATPGRTSDRKAWSNCSTGIWSFSSRNPPVPHVEQRAPPVTKRAA